MSAQPRFEQLEQLIEGFRVQPPLRDETLTHIGSLILADNDLASRAETIPRIDEDQYAVIERGSLGDNTSQAAAELDWDEAKVVGIRKQLLALYRVPEMSGVVNQAILDHTLPVTIKPITGMHLSKGENLTLEAFCVGIPNRMICQALRQSRIGFGNSLHLLVRKKLGANGRTNSVLRAYELGFRQIPDHRTPQGLQPVS